MDPNADPVKVAPPALLLRVVKGVHAGARIPITPNDVLVVGCADDCEVILSDVGVCSHHCILTARDAGVSLRPVDGAVTVDGRRYWPGQSAAIGAGIRVELGAAMFEITMADANEAVTVREGASDDVAPGLRSRIRQVRWALSVVVITAVACGLQPAVRGMGLHQVRAEASAKKAGTSTQPARSGAQIARDVAEVLRLSGYVAESLDEGHGTVRVRGHLGDPKAMAEVVQSRAMRDIQGLNRVLVVNLDQPGTAPDPDEIQIVAAVSSADPYIVTADGSRYYLGARLPHGGRLAGIEDGAVLVERDGRVERLRLPGASFGG